MRYTFEELQTAIREKINSDAINQRIEGYPLVAHLLIEYRDEPSSEERKRFRGLLGQLLTSPYLEIDARTKHGDTPLHSLVEEHDNEVDELLEMLLKKANPNALNCLGKTALECAIEKYPNDHITIKILFPVTEISDALRARCQEHLENATKNYDVNTINNLIELGLASRPESYLEDRSHEPGWFKQGVWVRSITNLEREKETLEKREGLSPEELRGHRNLIDSNYTYYSPAVFLRSGLPVMTFDQPNLIIASVSRIIDYWYDGLRGEQLTDHMRFDVGVQLRHSEIVEGQYNNVAEDDISTLLGNTYQKYIQPTLENGFDKYGILASRPYYSLMPWNEGLLRYQRQDILGILIEDTKEETITKALHLEKTLDLSFGQFYVYSSEIGGMSVISKVKLISKHRISKVDEGLPKFFSSTISESITRADKREMDDEKKDSQDGENSSANRFNP